MAEVSDCGAEYTWGLSVVIHPDGTGTREADGKIEAALSEITMREIFGDAVVDEVKKGRFVPKCEGLKLIVTKVDHESGTVVVRTAPK